MSKPKRYACLRQFGMLPAEDGIWVDYEDYAALAAENERLKSTIEAIYRIDPLLKEAVASAMLAAKEGRDAK